MLLDSEEYERARCSRDPRFDGRFFVGVVTTGVYCRPVCPVRLPRRENVRIYRSAAAAAAAGFRPCRRCRPESAPGTAAWDGSSSKVSRALRLIDQGFLDDGKVPALAREIGVGARQLTRLFQQHLGASPLQVARTRRLHFAKQLVDETAMPFSQICFAAGFGSRRRFNAVFREVYALSPQALRERRRRTARGEALELTLSYRPPFDWKTMLRYFAYRAIPGVEAITANSYARTIEVNGSVGQFHVTFADDANRVRVAIRHPEPRHLHHIVERVRSQFDLRADSASIDGYLARDDLLRPLVGAFPGLRVPGAWDGFEVAVRAILGQQITVKAATTLVGRVVQRFGRCCPGMDAGPDRVFPDAATLADANLDGMGIVGRRVTAIQSVAAMVADGSLRMDAGMDTRAFVETICRIPGIGEWTAGYIAMRALNDPNACPHADLILRRSAAPRGTTLSPAQMLARARPWQPWRAYAVMLLWRNYQTLKPALAGQRSRGKPG